MEQRSRKAIWETFPASCSLHQDIDREILVAEANERSPGIGRLLAHIAESEDILRNFEIDNMPISSHEVAEVIELPQVEPDRVDLAA